MLMICSQVKTSNDSWFECNDSWVSEVKQPFNENTDTAYVLFFMKDGTSLAKL